MAKAWSFDEACTIAGELYGNVLARNSDDAGYKHTVNQLNSGDESVREIVRRFCTSEEFREKYIMNQTPNELAKRLLSRLGRDRRPDPQAIKVLAVSLVEKGLATGCRRNSKFAGIQASLWRGWSSLVGRPAEG